MKGKLKEYILDIVNTRVKKLTAIAIFLSAFLCNIIIEICNVRSVWKGLIFFLTINQTIM